MRLGEAGETLDDNGELREDDVARVAEEDQVGVVGDVARGGAEVDNASGGGGTLAKDVDVRHDIVTALLLLDGRVCHLGLIKVLFRDVLRVNMHAAVGVGDLRRRTRLAFICSIASSVMLRPSCFSAVARLSQSLRQVPNRVCSASDLVSEL